MSRIAVTHTAATVEERHPHQPKTRHESRGRIPARDRLAALNVALVFVCGATCRLADSGGGRNTACCEPDRSFA